jgi:hypothetical protein
MRYLLRFKGGKKYRIVCIKKRFNLLSKTFPMCERYCCGGRSSFNLEKAFDPRRTRSFTQKFSPYENRVDHRNGGSLDFSN